ncbi:uncharacterized protein LOC110011696 [Sesamum indicum]|uniref:Uncharacterized protein LOC110011696 n=1 Tax=Sesamum indicum TaxID=4182 RepID=A0A8M8UNY6_SESIN|nr:uncharacterized protein LOC110011696 [Sesamum indicum]
MCAAARETDSFGQMMKMEVMDRRFNRHMPSEGRETASLQRKLAKPRRVGQTATQMPDLTDFMNDAFFGTVNGGDQKIAYNLNGGGRRVLRYHDEDDFDSSTRSVSSKQTQEWLEEAKRMVASSPSRGGDSPSRLVGSPRFGMSQGRFSTSSLDKRDPLSRSARRNRGMEGLSGEILSKTAIHTRNRSETNLDPPQADGSPASELHKWLSLYGHDPTNFPDPSPPSPTSHLSGPPLPPRQSMHRKSRFQIDPNPPSPHPIPTPTNLPAIKQNFKNTSTSPNNNDAPTATSFTNLLSPPKNLVHSAHQRSRSLSTCPVPEGEVLSPPRNLVESVHRRSISSSTCRVDRILQKDNNTDDGQLKNGDSMGEELNMFLKEQRAKIEKLLSGEIYGKAKIVLSGPSNSTSSMVAATCYAWLLENRMRGNKKDGGRNDNNLEFVVPVMNMRRGKMWKQRQAAWLFHHAGLGATSLLFSNEVDLETLMMEKQLSLLVVGEDILKTNGEVGSPCTVLTDNYCEDAYDLLQNPILKKLLLAGILLDTQNLSTSPKLSMTRDAEAVQLLSVGSTPNYRNTLYDQLVQDQRGDKFFDVLLQTYGKPPSDINWDSEHRVPEKIKSEKVIAGSDDKKQNNTNDVRTKKASPVPGKPTPSPVPAKSNVDTSRGKKQNFFAKLFGFGSK